MGLEVGMRIGDGGWELVEFEGGLYECEFRYGLGSGSCAGHPPKRYPMEYKAKTKFSKQKLKLTVQE